MKKLASALLVLLGIAVSAPVLYAQPAGPAGNNAAAPAGRGGRGAPAAAPEVPPPGFQQLFDGKSLNNWTVDSSEYAKNFSVRNGLLHIEGTGGWLRSTRQYSDFTLRVELRYLTEDAGQRAGISGIFLRAPATGGDDYGSGWPHAVEVQLSNRAGLRTAAAGDPRWGGQIVYRGVESPGQPGTEEGGPVTFNSAAAFKAYGKTGEWQTYEIQVVGQFATVLVNDRVVASGYLKPEMGYIGLQAETGAIEFRSIQIMDGVRPIPPSNSNGFVPIFDGKTFDGWKLANPESTSYSIKPGGIMSVNSPRSVGIRGVRPPPVAAAAAPACKGELFTEKEYGDFTLRFDARYDDFLADSGMFLRVPADGAGPTGTKGYQVELNAMGSLELPWNGLLFRQGDVPQGESMMDYHAAMKAQSKIGDWTTYEVQAEGPSLTIRLNGWVIGRVRDVNILKGKFGFQCEVNTTDLRNIQVREGDIAPH